MVPGAGQELPLKDLAQGGRLTDVPYERFLCEMLSLVAPPWETWKGSWGRGSHCSICKRGGRAGREATSTSLCHSQARKPGWIRPGIYLKQINATKKEWL